MNEFIVWDGKCFYSDCSYGYLMLKQNGIIYENLESDYGGRETKKTDFKPLFYIGIKDINNNKIYADCSIVEFDYIDLNMELKEWERRTYKGFFKWHQDMLSYCIHYDGGNEFFNEVKFFSYIFENFKVIDTIQENKLGLIK